LGKRKSFSLLLHSSFFGGVVVVVILQTEKRKLNNFHTKFVPYLFTLYLCESLENEIFIRQEEEEGKKLLHGIQSMHDRNRALNTAKTCMHVF
jgi:hypothetical protein